MNEYILKMIVGHEIADITEKIYTHRTVEDLEKDNKMIGGRHCPAAFLW